MQKELHSNTALADKGVSHGAMCEQPEPQYMCAIIEQLSKWMEDWGSQVSHC